VDKLNRIGVRIEELEERQDCLEDKLNPKVSRDRSDAGAAGAGERDLFKNR